MTSRKYRPITLVILLALVAASLVGAASANAEANSTQPVAPPGQVVSVFQAHGQDGVPGAWLSDGVTAESWVWVEADLVTTSAAQAEDEAPPWPADPTQFTAIATETPGTYWVWDVFRFVSADDGPSFWAPQWRLVTGVALLGR